MLLNVVKVSWLISLNVCFTSTIYKLVTSCKYVMIDSEWLVDWGITQGIPFDGLPQLSHYNWATPFAHGVFKRCCCWDVFFVEANHFGGIQENDLIKWLLYSVHFLQVCWSIQLELVSKFRQMIIRLGNWFVTR